MIDLIWITCILKYFSKKIIIIPKDILFRVRRYLKWIFIHSTENMTFTEKERVLEKEKERVLEKKGTRNFTVNPYCPIIRETKKGKVVKKNKKGNKTNGKKKKKNEEDKRQNK